MPERAGVTIATNGSKFVLANLVLAASIGKTEYTIKPEELKGEGGEMTYDLTKVFDTKDYIHYPLVFKRLAIQPVTNADGSAESKYNISDFGFYFDHFESSIENVSAEANMSRLPIFVAGQRISTTANVESMQLYGIDGKLIATAQGNELFAPVAHGIYIVRAGSLCAKIRL